MNFEKYINKVIEDFQEDINNCETYPYELTEIEKNIIKEEFEKHRKCFDNKKEFDDCDEELFVSVIYGDNESASIECMNCNTVLIDDLVLKLRN